MTERQCTVPSACGRFTVHLRVHLGNDGAQPPRMELSVFPDADGATTTKASVRLTERGTTSLAAPPHFRLRDAQSAFHYHYTASLDEAQVEALTSSAGVRKSFRNFADMVHSGLTGSAKCIQCYVETVDEMKQRITSDIRQKRDHQQQQVGGASGVWPASASAAASVERDGDETSNSLVHLSIHSDTAATQALVQRFLTIDYNVDFTRAVFPIPLTIVEESAARVEAQVIALSEGEEEDEQEGEARAEGSASEAVQLRLQLVETRAAATDLHARNQKLERENTALQKLCKEKMMEMQVMCERFQDHAELVAEVERLRRKNTDLRLRMRVAEDAHAEVERRLLEAMDQPTRKASQRDRSQSRRSAVREGSPSPRPAGLVADGAPTSTRPARSRRHSTLVSPTPLATGERRWSQQRQQQEEEEERNNTMSGRARRTTSSSSGRTQQHQQQHRAGNRFDTPPALASARGRVVGGSHAAAARRSTNRFDSDVGSDDPRTMGPYGGGGDAPAPRGRTGARPSPSRSPSWPSAQRDSPARSSTGGSIPSVHKTASRGRRFDTPPDRVHSRCSSVSSRASSTVSERLFHATTVSSRQRHDAILDGAVHRDTGRLDYHQQEVTTPSRRRSVFR